MKLLFLTLVKISSIEDRGIYQDLMRKFVHEGHEVFIVSPIERKEKIKTNIIKKNNINILNVRTFNIQKTNIIEKGLGTLAIEYQYLSAIKKYFSDIKFDIVIYSTPPITFSKVISFIKKRDNAYSYLLLKDIFPQNAVDLNMIKKNGIFHRFFLKKEKKLYQISDYIGCMSNANKTYLLKHNTYISPSIVEVNPNSIEPFQILNNENSKIEIKKKYGLPLKSKVFVYGGNLGIPQGIDFLIETITGAKDILNAFFLIIGTGTEYNKLEKWITINNPQNAILLNGLPKHEYDTLLSSCDIGLIFLSSKFTIPNFPSRLLSYLENSMPVLAATDINTDIGIEIIKHNAGLWVESGDLNSMIKSISFFLNDEINLKKMKVNAYNMLIDNYDVTYTYQLILNKIENV